MERVDLLIPGVVGRYVFYNNSVWDNYDAGAGPSDDLAIATDKCPLLPDGLASFANYTSYSRGINGIMVDIAGLAANPSAADFEFKIGNTATLAAWVPGPSPATVSVRGGAGVSASDRIVLLR